MGEHQKALPNPSKGTEQSETASVDQDRQLALDKKGAVCLSGTQLEARTA